MFRRICSLILLCISAGPALALTLGEIETQSALYQRFTARIELQQSRGENIQDLQVSLASAEDFARMNVERNFMLTQLQFELITERGQPVIEITSRRPIVEPYLDFVLEVIWRQGRMLKQYTILLDPPGLEQQAPTQTASPVQPAKPELVAQQPARQTSTATDYGPTKRNDTMWSIASRTRPDASVSVEQHMLAIKRLNPDAFINDNINLLKQGQVLKIPTADETASLTRRAATRMVQEETRAWQEDNQSLAQSPPAPAPTGQLRIVAEAGDRAGGINAPDSAAIRSPAENGPRAGTAGLAQDGTLNQQMDTLEQLADKRLESMQQTFAAQTEALAVKDQQLAELRVQLEQMQQEMDRLLAANNAAPVQATPAMPATQKFWLLAAAAAALLLLLWALLRGTTRSG